MGGLINLLGPRYKALAAVLVPLLGGLLFLISTGELDLKHIAGILAVALGAGATTHVVPNVAKAATETVGAVADTAVTEVNNVVTPVAEVTGGVVGKVTGLLGGILGKKPKP